MNEDPVENMIVEYMTNEVPSGHIEHSLKEIRDGIKSLHNPAPSEAEVLKGLGRLEARGGIGSRTVKKKKKIRTKYRLIQQPLHPDQENGVEGKK